MLSDRYSPDRLKIILLSHADWQPYPTAEQREPWEALPEPVRQAHLSLGDRLLNTEWPELQATRFLDFARNGDRNRYQAPHFARRSNLAGLVIAECLEGDGRFVDDIVNGVWAICEESYWGVPAHVGVQQAGSGLPDTAEPTVDLFAAETAALMAWTDYLLGPQLDDVSPLIRPRIQREIETRLLGPCFTRDDFWWMGFHNIRGRRVNNWNPWINSNWLTVTLLMEQDVERRVETVSKILRSLDKFIDPYPRDGGCDEGPSYWGRAGASLFDCLELLHSATDGHLNVYDEPVVQEIGRFIYRVQIHEDYFINFADAPALVYPNPALVYNFGQRIEDDAMQVLGAWEARRQGLLTKGFADGQGKLIESIGRQLPALFSLDRIQEAPAAQPLPRDVWLDEIQVMVARDQAGSSQGFFVAAKGGHNDESHNHNDVGNFVVYLDGKPVLIDVGVEEYTRKTFGPQRYEIWTMQSTYHNLLPTIDGVMQEPGANFSARNVSYESEDEAAQLRLEIARAYPHEAKLASWIRTVTLKRSEGVIIEDQYELVAPAESMILSLLTPCIVNLEQEGQILLKEAKIADERRAGSAAISYDAQTFTAFSEVITIDDPRLNQAWGKRLARIVLHAAQPPQKGTLTLQVSR